SSTVMTPSLPTLSIASAMISPTLGSAAEIDAVDAICSLVSTSLLCFESSSETRSTATSMPFFSDIGLAPAATLRRPSRTSAWASTVAVVVPSPATSSVFFATSLTSSAPIFSHGSSSSISLAMETPSLVMVGAPHFFSSTTLRPFGPSVTLTASARVFMPRSSPRRASSSNAIILAIAVWSSTCLDAAEAIAPRAAGLVLGQARCPRRTTDRRHHPYGVAANGLTVPTWHSPLLSANPGFSTLTLRVQAAPGGRDPCREQRTEQVSSRRTRLAGLVGAARDDPAQHPQGYPSEVAITTNKTMTTSSVTPIRVSTNQRV